MKLTLGFSPCPNDTFIFDALINKKIDTGDFEFEVALADVETLNQWALAGKLSITKLSFPAFFRSLQHYTLLNAGSALGKGVGPLLITDTQHEISEEDVNQASIALPGLHTTANLLFSFAYPEAIDKHFMVFSAIENALLNKEVDLGVIIHENRFTYHQKGLHKIKDLGEYWEDKMGLPIPLGGIAIHQSIKRSVALQINELIKKSIAYAFNEYPIISDYTKKHSQEMSEEVMRQHINLYVNKYSIDLGDDGRMAIENLHNVFLEINDMDETDDEDVLFL
jgi:1,4-dihydroxy-6-naphthoate synthase